MLTFEEVGQIIGQLTDIKNKAYGGSFQQAGAVLRVLYPHGVQPDQYDDLLFVTRVIDKLFRIATSKNAFGENPARDIAGYGILASQPGMEAERETADDAER